MAVHDEVMPKMGKIRNLEKQCRSVALTSPDSSELIRQAESLSNANEAMMIWMREFNSDFQGSDSEKREYLLAQKMKIYHVKDLMNSSLSEGEIYCVVQSTRYFVTLLTEINPIWFPQLLPI